MEIVELKDNNLDVVLYKGFLNESQSDWMLNNCLDNILWKQDKYNFSGREVLAPRLTALYGDKPYSYSGQKLNPVSFTPALNRLREITSEISGANFNVVLLNKYRDGNDSVSWHTDAESSLGRNPVIGSVSLGGSKPFKLREIGNKSNQHEIILDHGDLLVMKGETQHYWEHSIQKSKKHIDLRINLTFRVIV